MGLFNRARSRASFLGTRIAVARNWLVFRDGGDFFPVFDFLAVAQKAEAARRERKETLNSSSSALRKKSAPNTNVHLLRPSPSRPLSLSLSTQPHLSGAV
jgi:hypothetical protein